MNLSEALPMRLTPREKRKERIEKDEERLRKREGERTAWGKSIPQLYSVAEEFD